jgi:hypothetical protein
MEVGRGSASWSASSGGGASAQRGRQPRGGVTIIGQQSSQLRSKPPCLAAYHVAKAPPTTHTRTHRVQERWEGGGQEAGRAGCDDACTHCVGAHTACATAWESAQRSPVAPMSPAGTQQASPRSSRARTGWPAPLVASLVPPPVGWGRGASAARGPPRGEVAQTASPWRLEMRLTHGAQQTATGSCTRHSRRVPGAAGRRTSR